MTNVEYTSDRVNVVRCKNCTAWETDWKPNHSLDDERFCPMVGIVTSKDWFCAYGERKEDE